MIDVFVYVKHKGSKVFFFFSFFFCGEFCIDTVVCSPLQALMDLFEDHIIPVKGNLGLPTSEKMSNFNGILKTELYCAKAFP